MAAVSPSSGTLGMLGGGQLGRMFALAAQSMGFRVVVFAPEEDPVAAAVADAHVRAEWSDEAALRHFASQVDVVGYEFENIPPSALDVISETTPVYPNRNLLATTQHRIREKRALRDAGVQTVDFAEVRSSSSLADAAETIGFPSILKTAAWGYDGKGQRRVENASELEAAWAELSASGPAVLEAVANFHFEISIVGARSADGEIALFEPSLNEHRNHILDLSISPAPLSEAIRQRAQESTRSLLEHWDVVGVLCVEMFVMDDDVVLVNEVAPRPHNSGHLTIDACAVSQFEQQVRAIAGLPLGSVAMKGPSAMANLLGDQWDDGEPDWPAALAEGVKLHLYGKKVARPARKMGHLTAVADSPEKAAAMVRKARNALGQSTQTK